MRKQHEFTADEVAAAQAEFPGLSEAEARISLERRQVYGDPYQNHYGIAQSWAGLLQVWAPRIARGEPIPPHVVALMMAALKTNRCRLQFHKDNYDDANVYMTFASAFQQRWEREGGEEPCPDPMAYFTKEPATSDYVARMTDGKIDKVVPLDSPSSGEMRIPSKGDTVGDPERRQEWEVHRVLSMQFEGSRKMTFSSEWAGRSDEISFPLHAGQSVAIIGKPMTYEQAAKQKKENSPPPQRYETVKPIFLYEGNDERKFLVRVSENGKPLFDEAVTVCKGDMLTHQRLRSSTDGATSIRQEPRDPPSA